MAKVSVCYPVLGCHGGGTSLVSALLRDLGVNMGTDFMGSVKDYPTWEDKDFTRLNMRILHMAGGKWSRVPPRDRIMDLKNNHDLMRQIKQTITKKTCRNRWGFKDPRLPLTIPLYHPHLPNPRYIVVKRSSAAIAKSIMSRGGKTTKERWAAFADEHFNRIGEFLADTDATRLIVQYENLVNHKTALGVIGVIARYIRCKRPGRAAQRALMVVRFR